MIYVGQGAEHPGLYRRALHIRPDEIHWIRPDMEMAVGEQRDFSIRIRYRQPLQKGTLRREADGMYVVFEQPQRGVTAGQFAAWYDGDELMGSGVIDA